jgi:hypothetical protein
MTTLPTKPAMGGRPAMVSAQTMKARPRNAMAAGMARPNSACSSSSRLTSRVRHQIDREGEGVVRSTR